VLGIQILRGRNFTDADRAGGPKVAIVNDAAARHFWPNESAIGKIIAVGQGGFGDGAEVIGVVSNVRYRTLEAGPQPDVFIPFTQSYRSSMRIFVRSRTDLRTLAASIRREVRELDPNLPLAEVKTMQERLADAMWRTRVAVWLFSAFAVLALLLTAIGIFGVMSQTVSQRTGEIGVRMALGAHTRDVMALMLRRATLLATAGITFGIGGAILLTRLMTTLLYEVEPGDPTTLVAVSLLLGFVALLACYVPARRAAGVDPLVALRYE
jgi:predicted permease